MPKADIMLEIRLNQVRTDDESRAAYDIVYSEADISQPHSFYLWIYDLLMLRPGDAYLDVSCGRGELLRLARETQAEPFGIDLSHNALKIGQAASEYTHLTVANSQELPYADNSFDVISNIGSIEHYVDMQTAVREMARVLKPNGRAVVLVPNTFSLLNNIWIALRQGRTSIDPYQPIQRYGARYEWQELLEDNGLVVQKTIKYDRVKPRTRNELKTLLSHPKELARLILAPFVPLNLAFCFVFICHKANN